MVPREPSHRRGPRFGGIILGWCHIPHNGRPSDHRGRLRLGNAHLRLPNPCLAYFRQHDRTLPHSAYETSIRSPGFRPTVEGANVPAPGGGYVLLLLSDDRAIRYTMTRLIMIRGNVYPIHFHHRRRSRPRNVPAPRQLPRGDP